MTGLQRQTAEKPGERMAVMSNPCQFCGRELEDRQTCSQQFEDYAECLRIGYTNAGWMLTGDVNLGLGSCGTVLTFVWPGDNPPGGRCVVSWIENIIGDTQMWTSESS